MAMYKNKYPHLFSPIVLGNTLFKNRIFASPTGYQFTNGDGYVNDASIAYYSRKAMGGAASVASFQGFVDGELGKGDSKHICLDKDNIEQNLFNIAFGIKTYGAVASLELAHCGMFANRTPVVVSAGGLSSGDAYAPVECVLDGRIVPAMSEEIIDRTIRKYAESALFAKRCGFGMVTIHGGHGWLLHQFISPITNTRKDKWGGSDIENRARLTIEVCKAIRKAVGPGFPIEIRISASECYDGGYGLENGIAFAKQLDGFVDLIHVSGGNHEVKEVFTVTHPSMFLGEGCFVPFAEEIKKQVKTPVGVVGALSDPAFMEDIIASGKADVVEMARALICDPDLPIKVRAGREAEVKQCMRCLACFSNRISYGRPYCAINPESGREPDMRYDIPPVVKKKVLIAGGGVGGMQAALTCALRGHSVILCEKKPRLGGVLRCEVDVNFKERLGYYLDQQEAAVRKAGIDLRLNTEVTPKLAAELSPDVIIAALGAAPLKPEITGIDGENVMSAQEAYTAIDKIGQKVVILGAGLVGVELGIHLKGKNKDVTIIEVLDHISDGGNFLHILGVENEMRRLGLEVSFNTNAKKITHSCVVCERAGEEKSYTCDTIIYAVGQKPVRDEAIALGAFAPEFHMLGDCISPRNLVGATSEAFIISRNLGRV